MLERDNSPVPSSSAMAVGGESFSTVLSSPPKITESVGPWSRRLGVFLYPRGETGSLSLLSEEVAISSKVVVSTTIHSGHDDCHGRFV